MTPFWIRLLTGLAKEIIPPLWDAITQGDAEKAAILATLAANRYTEHAAAKVMLDEISRKKKAAKKL